MYFYSVAFERFGIVGLVWWFGLIGLVWSEKMYAKNLNRNICLEIKILVQNNSSPKQILAPNILGQKYFCHRKYFCHEKKCSPKDCWYKVVLSKNK